MRKLTVEEWEAKYIVSTVERFDQKYTMFNRPGWDPEIRGRSGNWSFVGEAKSTAGYSLQDQALRWASRQCTLMDVFNTSKPNPTGASQAVAAAIANSNSVIRALSYRPPAGAKIDVSDTRTITRDIKKVATYFGADLVGVCRLDRRWVYSHTYERPKQAEAIGSDVTLGESKLQEIPQECQYVVVMAFEEEYEMMQHYPTYIADAATSMGYSRMAITNAHLSAFIRNLGYKAIDCSTNDVAISIPLAVQAGLGDLGRNGLLITRQYGPRVRISKVITDLPLVADTAIDFGVTAFCMACQICADKCPSQSIPFGERTAEPNNISNVGGVLKWPVDAETCRMRWARSNKPCTVCIASCPFNKPDTLFHRVVRWFVDHIRWADPFYTKMDALFGYGKSRKADNFWEEWQPGRRRYT